MVGTNGAYSSPAKASDQSMLLKKVCCLIVLSDGRMLGSSTKMVDNRCFDSFVKAIGQLILPAAMPWYIFIGSSLMKGLNPPIISHRRTANDHMSHL